MMLFLTEDGSLLPITNMFDIDGDETSNPDEAVSLVAVRDDGLWLASTCEPHEIVKAN